MPIEQQITRTTRHSCKRIERRARIYHGRQQENKLRFLIDAASRLVVTVLSLPGYFANHSILLQPIRMTTSYEKSMNDLNVDLFGFSGDATRRHDPDWAPFFPDVPHNLNQTLLGKEGLNENVTLCCQPDFDYVDGKISLPRRKPKSLIKMFFLPMATIDSVQTIGSVAWRGNVTELMNKRQLIQHIDRSVLAGNSTGIQYMTVHVWRLHKLEKQCTSRLSAFQITLDTGSLGIGTAYVQNSSVAKSHFHRPLVAAGLCVAIYGIKPLKYLRQFVQHHLNAGFGSIVIGVKGPEHGTTLITAVPLHLAFICFLPASFGFETYETRNGSIGQDFAMRKVDYDNTWQKSVVNTKYAHMSGIHVPGSCFFEKTLDASQPYDVYESKFYPFSDTDACSPRRFEHEVYGSIHHFGDLVVSRWSFGETNDNVTQLDEYVSLYAKTVDEQLARDDRKGSISA